MCVNKEGEEKKEKDEVGEVEEVEEVKLLENGLAGSDLVQEHMRGFDRIMEDGKNEANISD